MTDVGRNAQQIDQHRNEQKSAADTHDRADEADEEADRQDRNGGHVDARPFEAEFEGQPVEPGMAAGAAQFDRLALLVRMMARTLSITIKAPTEPSRST